jgi:hypothetical protein
LKFCLGHLISLYGSVMTRCQDNRSCQLERGVCSHNQISQCIWLVQYRQRHREGGSGSPLWFS